MFVWLLYMEIRVACGKIFLEIEFSFVPLHRVCLNEYLAMYSRDTMYIQENYVDCCRLKCLILSEILILGCFCALEILDFITIFILSRSPVCTNAVNSHTDMTRDSAIKCSVINPLCESNQE